MFDPKKRKYTAIFAICPGIISVVKCGYLEYGTHFKQNSVFPRVVGHGSRGVW